MKAISEINKENIKAQYSDRLRSAKSRARSLTEEKLECRRKRLYSEFSKLQQQKKEYWLKLQEHTTAQADLQEQVNQLESQLASLNPSAN